MGSHCRRLMRPGSDCYVVKTAGDTRGNPFLLPSTAILGKCLEVAFSFDYITVQKEGVFDPHAIEIISKTLPIYGPASHRLGKGVMCIVIPVQINELFVRKTLVPMLEPSQRLIDRCPFALKPAPTKIKQITTPHTCI